MSAGGEPMPPAPIGGYASAGRAALRASEKIDEPWRV